MTSALTVAVHGVEVGILEVFDEYCHRFTFSPAYTKRPVKHRPVLGQIFEDRMPSVIDVAGPMCWFSHLLPQGVMRTWRSRLLGLEVDDEFELLTYLGEDMPGAVTLTPGSSPVDRRNASPEKELAKNGDPRFKFSLAGAQWKLSAQSSGRGLTTQASGEGRSFIAKFDAPEFPNLPRCEFATMNWAKHSGILVPNFDLKTVSDFDELPDEFPTGSGDVFVIERFDRSDTGRIHVEDFGQILDRPPGQRQYQGSYEDIAKVISWICPQDKSAFVNLLVFNVLCGNGDAHLKNFSVLYPDGRNARLAPAYDLVSTICFYSPNKEDLALALAGTKYFREIDKPSFAEILRILRLTDASIVDSALDRVMQSWNDEAVRGEFLPAHAERIDQHLTTLVLN
ncbi:MAG: type II toxin-antitoxin system HipA family toxin [Planctomycetaceae bacterium]|nr:type II toxin-antitoxin system HipA family toxin [Planctomycetaceae bacterium]MCA9085738.1 type II toxin-antitoxin system HipA family toxin [Planctomycetaceae bacterium]